ncbi:MAG: FAD-dependent oxidoreductase [Actinobacteria bacterium]|nr:FAD-dependent oxidoreductase [Actinomycetota bacterium]
MILTLFNKVVRTSDTTSFYFKPQIPVKWEAGQYMHFTLPHENPDSRGISRFFTISSAPFEKDIMITTRFASEVSSSFKKVLLKMEIGQNISASMPQGELVVKDFAKSYIFIAGGIGITPFRSILLDLDFKKQLRKMKIFLFYSNRNNDIVFKEELDNLVLKNQDLKIIYIISPQTCDIELIKKTAPDFPGKIYFISGPINMVKSMEDILNKAGIESDKIKKDYFPGY